MKIYENASLAELNMFRFHSMARYFVEVQNRIELTKALSFARRALVPLLVIGEGSNVVLRKSFHGMAMRLKMNRIRTMPNGPGSVLVEAQGGLVWDRLVDFCLERGYFGIENLAMIPGTVGAAPVQNIGAYGVELKDVFHSLEALDIMTGKALQFDRVQCKFGYRDSVFKWPHKDRFVITSVTLRLSARPQPILTDHVLVRELAALKCSPDSLTPAAIATIVRSIRARRLPKRNTLGNAGSFFVNPVVSRRKFDWIRERFCDAPGFQVTADEVKLSAGWLIEKCGFKGVKWRGVGVYPRNPLVLVNYSSMYAAPVLELSEQIKGAVQDVFGIRLVMEPSIYGQD